MADARTNGKNVQVVEPPASPGPGSPASPPSPTAAPPQSPSYLTSYRDWRVEAFTKPPAYKNINAHVAHHWPRVAVPVSTVSTGSTGAGDICSLL